MAKTNNTKRMVAMALAAAVTVTAVPVDAYAASSYSAKVARAQKKADAAKAKKLVKINEHLKEEVVKVTVSVEEGAEDSDTFGEKAGTVNGNEETVQQGSVTVETTDSKVTEGNGSMPEDMDYVASETAPSGSNDLIDEQFGAYGTPDEYLPNPEEGANQTGPALGADDSENQFELVGAGNTSQYRPLAVFTEGMSREEKIERYGNEAYIPQSLKVGGAYWNHYAGYIEAENPGYLDSIKVDGEYQYDEDGYLWDPVKQERVVKSELTTEGLDGEKYYLHRFDANGTYTKDWYNEETGEWEEWSREDTPYNPKIKQDTV